MFFGTRLNGLYLKSTIALLKYFSLGGIILLINNTERNTIENEYKKKYYKIHLDYNDNSSSIGFCWYVCSI